MIVVIGDLFDAHELAALREAADRLDYVDGRGTAGRYAREVKSNLQAAPSPQREAIFAKLRQAMLAHEVVRSVAREQAPPMVSVVR